MYPLAGEVVQEGDYNNGEATTFHLPGGTYNIFGADEGGDGWDNMDMCVKVKGVQVARLEGPMANCQMYVYCDFESIGRWAHN